MKRFKLKINPLPLIIFLVIISLTIIGVYDTFYNKDNLEDDIKPLEENNFFDTNVDENSTTNDLSLDEKFIEATVTRVVDGDTIIANFNNKDYRVRLIGVNSPESTTKIEEYGKEASQFTTKMLTGKTVYLEKDVSETDKYGRLLRYVWLKIPNRFSEDEIKEKMFNAILVINGYAQASTYPPDVKYSNYFSSFETIARNKNLGLWKSK